MADYSSDKSSFQSSGRGRGRGGRSSDRGGWRGNQRGRGGPASPGNTSRQNSSRPQLTHFLSIPLGHLPAVQSAMSSFGSQLLSARPPIDGLDHSIVVTPRRLHLTLGVMSLEEDDAAALSAAGGAAQAKKTVSAALEYLRKIRPSINNALNGHALRVPLTAIDIMKPERNDASRAHIMFTGPSESDLRSVDGQRLKHVCELINSEFIKAGFVVDDKRPLKLHCTLINTSHRKPRPQGGYSRRVPFSFTEVCNSDAVRRLGIAEPQSTSSTSTGASEMVALTQQTRTAELESQGKMVASSVAAMEKVAGQNTGSYAVPVNFGTHTVSEIQICRMGSWGPEGEYVCVGKISLDGK